MKKKAGKLANLILRYIILLVLGLAIPLFYKTLLPLTFYPSYFLLKIFYPVYTSCVNCLTINGINIIIADACVAASAYYLLLILNLSTDMNARQRGYSLLFSIFSLLVLNVLRIVFIAILYVSNFTYADIVHNLVWHVFSIIFVIGIWFFSSWLFKIKNIPVWTDLRKIKKLNKS